MESNKKIRVLAVPSDTSGVGNWRTIWPHTYLQEKYGDEFDVDIIMVKDFPRDNLTEFFKQYDIVSYHKQLDKRCEMINLLDFLEIPTVLDLDDSYLITRDHPLFLTAQREKWAETIVNHIRKSSYVTTTTPMYAKELSRHNKNVCVLPNAIDKEFMPQFQQTKKPSERIRFGIVCGSTHLHDIELMKGISTLPKSVLDKVQFCLCGFDFRGKVTYWNKNTNETVVKDIERKQSVWCRYEEFVTNNYATVSKEHADWLRLYLDADDPFTDEPYRRFMTKNINEYARHYENVDILLAPLKENDFNARKSELKEIECAYTDTALVASSFGPYKLNLVPYIEKGGGINPDGNALVVDPSKNHKQWAKYVTYVAEHPECIKAMSDNLKRDIYGKYSLAKVTDDRAALYRRICAERNVS